MKLLQIFSIACIITILSTSCSAQFNLNKTLEDVGGVIKGNSGSLSNEDVIAGLKQALSIGSGNAADVASKVNGYYKNPAIMIPFPPEAKTVENAVRNIGMGSMVDDFVESLNRAAEQAAKEAAPIFIDAVKQMTINDGWNILKGSDHAATNYLQDKTSAALYKKFEPVVKAAIEKVQVTKYWEPIITRYNKIPFMKTMNPDLQDYTTQKAIEGLFYLVSKEEEKIRNNPGARVTDLLERVFSQAK